MGKCHKCGYYSCHCHKSCDPCDCIEQVKGYCVFYRGENLDCLGVTKGDNYDDILSDLNDLVCDLIPPSGIFTTLTTCSSDISLTLTTPSGIPNYRICLNPEITDQIEENTNDILVLEECLIDNVYDLVSDTILITEESEAECGRTLRLEVISPSGLPTYDGIVYNDLAKVGTTGAVGDKLLKQFTHNYAVDNLLAHDDEIRFRANGQILGDGAAVDNVKIELFDSTSATVLHTATFTGFALGDVGYSWEAEGVLAVTSVGVGTGVYTIKFLALPKGNGFKGNVTTALAVINADVSAIDYANLTVRVIYVHNSTTGATDNFARQLMVEVRKKI